MAGHILSFLKRTTTLLRPGLLAQATVYGSNAVGLFYYMKHSVFLTNYKKYIERLGDYGPEEPAEELKELLNEIITKDLKDVASENTPVSLYLTPGLETTHLGTVGSLGGGFVGVPVFYEFKNEEEVKDNIMIRHVSDAENHQEEELVYSFLLSNTAKKYGIAREILLINTLKVYINAFLPFAVSMMVVTIYKGLHETYYIYRKPLYMRGLIYIAVILGGLNVWRYLYKNVLRFYDSEVEEKIALLGMDYVEGGIEYCSKEVIRNSLPIEIKNEKLRIVKAFEDLLGKLFVTGIPPKVKLEYLVGQREQLSKNLKQ